LDPLSGLAYGFQVALTPQNLAAALAGALLGTAVGILPGLGPTTVIALLLIPTIGLPPETGLIMLGGIYYGTQYGDSMTAILMNVPSEAPSVVIGLDGHEIARRGRAGVALAVAAVGAFAGASIGLLGLVALAGVLAPIGLAISPSEYFALSLTGLVILAKVSGGGTWKGLLALAIGLALPTVGLDPLTGFTRFGFGVPDLMQGFSQVPVIMGLIGLSGILQLTGVSRTLPKPAPFKFREIFPTRAEWLEAFPASVRGAIIGFIFGVLPGPGTVLSTFVSYRLERRLAPHRVGQGAVSAVAGPKAADDASISGHLVPLMVLGIPFSSVTAILFAGILLHGIQPGPLLMTQHPEIFWGLVAAMYIGNLALLILNFPLVGMWMSILRIPQPILTAMLVLLLLIGSYSLNNSFFDTLVLIGAGVLGYFLRLFDIDRTVVVLGLVLGPLVEKNFRLALIISRGNAGVFFSTWADNAFWLVLILFVFGPMLWHALRRARARTEVQLAPAAK
jgi:putative tricarboxylic transport membrane protein